jgi:hypothetical protein
MRNWNALVIAARVVARATDFGGNTTVVIGQNGAHLGIEMSEIIVAIVHYTCIEIRPLE